MEKTKMTVRKMLELLTARCHEHKVYNVKMVDIASGEIFEAKRPIDLIYTAARTWNLLWEVEIIAARRAEQYIMIVFDSDIEQENGDPDFPIP